MLLLLSFRILYFFDVIVFFFFNFPFAQVGVKLFTSLLHSIFNIQCFVFFMLLLLFLSVFFFFVFFWSETIHFSAASNLLQLFYLSANCILIFLPQSDFPIFLYLRKNCFYKRQKLRGTLPKLVFPTEADMIDQDF